MEIDLIFRIAGVGIVVSILNQILMKSDKAEYAALITVTGIIIVVLMVIPQIRDLFEAIRELVDF